MRTIKMITAAVVILSLALPLQAIAASYGKTLCETPGFYCQRVKPNQTWSSLFPDPHDRSIVMRINRMNIRLWAGMVIAVPENLAEADIMDFAPFPKRIQSHGEKIVAVDPVQAAWGAYDAEGRLLRWGPASAGRDWCNDVDEECRTRSGKFRIYSLGSSDCYSRKFPLPDGGAPMPYCMYFHGGQALHGEPSGLPGYNDSHGCVRMYVSDAEWLRYDFIEGPNASNKFKGTRIVVGQYATPDKSDDDAELNS